MWVYNCALPHQLVCSRTYAQTLLMVACKYGRVEIVRMLLDEFKADINMVGGLGRFNALHYAAWHGHANVVKYVLRGMRVLGNAQVGAHDAHTSGKGSAFPYPLGRLSRLFLVRVPRK